MRILYSFREPVRGSISVLPSRPRAEKNKKQKDFFPFCFFLSLFVFFLSLFVFFLFFFLFVFFFLFPPVGTMRSVDPMSPSHILLPPPSQGTLRSSTSVRRISVQSIFASMTIFLLLMEWMMLGWQLFADVPAVFFFLRQKGLGLTSCVGINTYPQLQTSVTDATTILPHIINRCGDHSIIECFHTGCVKPFLFCTRNGMFSSDDLTITERTSAVESCLHDWFVSESRGR